MVYFWNCTFLVWPFWDRFLIVKEARRLYKQSCTQQLLIFLQNCPNKVSFLKSISDSMVFIVHTLSTCTLYFVHIDTTCILGCVELRHYYVYTTFGVLALYNLCVTCISNRFHSFQYIQTLHHEWLFKLWRYAPRCRPRAEFGLVFTKHWESS